MAKKHWDSDEYALDAARAGALVHALEPAKLRARRLEARGSAG